jgi:hypothetical protein
MTSLDLTLSFYQIELHPNSGKYCAFSFEGKIFQFTRVSFGGCISISASVGALEHALGDEVSEYRLNFVDDLLIVPKSFPEHLHHISTVTRDVTL